MIDSVLLILVIATAIFLAVFFLGLRNIIDGVAHQCWHSWENWEDPHNTGKDVCQLRKCTKCNQTEFRVVVYNAQIQDLEKDTK